MEGDRLRSHDGTTVVLGGVSATGELAPVYNLRVADYHTYFVGGRYWGFSVWAHNAYGPNPQERLSSSVGDLRAARRKDAHHVIQDAAVRELPGYDTNLAPGVQLLGPSTAKGTPHYNATQVQRQSGGGTYAAERRIGYKSLRSAGYTEAEARQTIQEADDYFRSIDVTLITPTRSVGNRN